ncbi:hypothetical protein Tco_0623791 [Tanacetum coccineum]|uniref:Uncharacterized protein n=1 Tax=Tanacetum coccineum TaxID=301880 RepID=A0ABQ4WC86_9ASTR
MVVTWGQRGGGGSGSEWVVVMERARGGACRLYDDCYDEEEGSYRLKDLDAYSIRVALLDDALPTKEKDSGSFTLPCFINNLCFNKAVANLGASVSVMPFSTYTNLGIGELSSTKLIVELADRTVKHPKGIAENVLVGIDKFVFPVDFIVLDMPEDIKTPLILGRPFLMELDLEARLMGEALILNRSLDPLYGDYIELNDVNEPLELRRNQVDDLEPTIEEGEVVDEPMMDIVKTRCDDEIIDGLDEYPSYCYFDSFYNSIIKDKLEFKGRNVVGAFMNIPIFVGNFSVVTNFTVVENMDSYRDDGMGDIIVGEPFFRESCVKTRRFDGMITIYKGNDNVTYQMARSHPRFKHLTNAQCNKMRPLVKVSA